MSENKPAPKNFDGFILKNLYQTIFENTGTAILIIDENDFIILVNAECEKLSGYDKETIEGRMKWSDFIVSDDLENLTELPPNGRLMCEAAFIKKDGTILDTEIQTVSIGNNLYQFIVRDITKQKQAEAAVRGNEELYRMIFENSPLGISRFDRHGIVTHCNNRLAEILGASKEKIIGLKKNELINDAAVTLRVTFSSMMAEDGSLLGGVGVYEDISERITAENALRRSETYNRLILNGITEAVALYEVVDGTAFRFVQANNNLLKFLGLNEDEVIGRYIEDVLPPEMLKTCQKKNRKVVKQKEPICYEENFGSSENYNIRLYPVLDDESKCTHLIRVTHNITEQKKIEEHELKIAKLESVGLLAGGIAHDFNNILTAIFGNASLAKMKINSSIIEKEKVLNWIDEIERASHQAKDLTQQLLTFAKGGKPILKVISIGSLLKETAVFALSGANVCCEYKISSDLWPVEVDEGQMSQVINNLVINAKHAMREGGVITISAENAPESDKAVAAFKKGKYIKITVQDQGCGIPPENLDKIFDPYFTTKKMGSGLGLTTTYAVVRKHQGYITLESEVGVGTTFNIYLPAAKGRVASKLIGIQTTLIGKGKILVMDDEKIIRLVLSEMLKVLGYEAVCVKDGTEAIEIYTEAMGSAVPFDLVIMDLTIPGGLGGKETVRKLLDIDPKVRAIVSSGYSNDPVMADHKKYGFLGVVSKPYNVEKLAEVLEKVINNSPKHRRIKTIS